MPSPGHRLVRIKRVFRERESLFWLFVGPVIFTVFFGLLFRPQPPRARSWPSSTRMRR